MANFKIYGIDTHIPTTFFGHLGLNKNHIIKAIQDFARTYLEVQKVSKPLNSALKEASLTEVPISSQDSPYNRLFMYFRQPSEDAYHAFSNTPLTALFNPNKPCGFPNQNLIQQLEQVVTVVQAQMQAWGIQGLTPSLPNNGSLFETSEKQMQHFEKDRLERLGAMQQILDINRQQLGEAGWLDFKNKWGPIFYTENNTLSVPSTDILDVLLRNVSNTDTDIVFPEKAKNSAIFSGVRYSVKYVGIVAQECTPETNTEKLSRGTFDHVKIEGLGALLSFRKDVKFSVTTWILPHEIGHMFGGHIHELNNISGENLLHNIHPDLMALLCGPRRSDPDGAPGAASIYPVYCADNGYQIERGNSTALAFPGLPERGSGKFGLFELMHAKWLLAPEAEKPHAFNYGVKAMAQAIKTMHAQECMAQFSSAFTRTFMSTVLKGLAAKTIQNQHGQRVAFAAAQLLASTMAAVLLSANGYHAVCMAAAGVAGGFSPTLGALADVYGSAQTMNMIVELSLGHSWGRVLLIYQILGQVLARCLGELCLSLMYKGVQRPQAYLGAQGVEYNSQRPSSLSMLASYVSAQLPSMPNSLRQSKVAGLLYSLGTRLQTTLQKAHTIDTQVANKIKSWCPSAWVSRRIFVRTGPSQTEIDTQPNTQPNTQTGTQANAV